MKLPRPYALWLSLPLMLGLLSFSLWDDVREWGAGNRSAIQAQDTMPDAELLRLSLKICKYYATSSVDENKLRQYMAAALASPAKAQQFALDMLEMWTYAASRRRYDGLCREVATRWMLRAAQGGEPAARLLLATYCNGIVPVEGFHSEEENKKALAAIESKPELTLTELQLLSSCYSQGVGAEPNEAKARDYHKRALEKLRSPR